MTTINACSCGCTETHVIARRKTADDIAIKLWSDGMVTAGVNFIVKGAPRSPAMIARAVAGGWLAMGEVELYEHREVARLVDAAREAVKACPADPVRRLRAVMAGAKFQAVKGGRVVRHARSCECPACERTRTAASGTAPFRGPRRIG